MNIKELSDNLLKTFEEISAAFSQFQSETKLPCLPSCGKCCLTPDIETSVLEMLPFALKIHQQGLLEEWLEKLQTSERKYCDLYEGDETSGRCGHYNERPAICRMFGVAGITGKNQRPCLSVCRPLRSSSPDQVRLVEDKLDTYQVPMMAQWYRKITSVGDPTLHKQMPINQAARQALEKVAIAAQYQDL